jgi:hypothetical protein
MAIIGTALWRLIRYDHDRRHGAELYGLIFFSLSNVADTIIFGAAVFYEVFYWYLSIMALGLAGLARQEGRESVSTSRLDMKAACVTIPSVRWRSNDENTPITVRRHPLLQG